MIDITNGTLKKVSKLAKGYHYYFAVTAYNEAGQESDYSEELVVNTCKYKLSPGKKTFNPEGGSWHSQGSHSAELRLDCHERYRLAAHHGW